MKLISWNVNGLRAVLKKNFLEFLDTERPDVLEQGVDLSAIDRRSRARQPWPLKCMGGGFGILPAK